MSGRISFGVQIASLLMATFFGGFLFLQAAPVEVSFTIDGESAAEVAVGESATFSVTFENSDEVTSEVLISILDESFFEVEGLENISCGSGEDFSLDFEVDCFWDPAFEGSESVSFDAVIEDAGEYTLFVTTYTDDPEDFGTEHEFSVTAVEEAASFTFDSGETYDTDTNGYIDTFKLSFSDTVDMDSVLIENISIDGYTVSSTAAWIGDDAAVEVVVEEGALYDTDATPDVTVSSVSSAGEVEMDSQETLTAVDMAGPVLVSGELSVDGLTVSLLFSEDLNGTTVNGTGTDFALSEGSIDSADEVSAGEVELTLSEVLDVETLEVTLLDSSVQDLEENTNDGDQGISILRAEDTTPITIEFVGLTATATSTDAVMVGDEITLTFLLAEEAAGVSVDLVGEIDVAVATVGTTYTATYTVDLDTPSGTVTFSISVLDDSENESTAAETTDESALVVYQEEEEVVVEGSSLEVSIPLTSVNGGLNLISLPIAPEDTSISSVLDEIIVSVEAVWTYIGGTWYVYYPDNAALSNLTSMEVGYAYFIEVSEDVTLTVLGDLWNTSRDISSGWQLVGYPQIDEETTDVVSIDTAFSSIGLAGVAYTDVVSYEDGEETSASDVSLGDGFWMNIIEDEVTLSASL